MFLMQLGIILTYVSIVKIGIVFAVLIGILLIVRKLILNSSSGTRINIHDANAELKEAEDSFEDAKKHLDSAETKIQGEEKNAKKLLKETGDLKEEIENKKHIINK